MGMAVARKDKAIVTTTVTVAMVSSATMIGDSKQITARQDQPQRTIPGKTGVNGVNALSPVVELAPQPGPATALARLMVEMNARLPQRPKRKAAMLQLAGPTLETGHSAPCPAEAPAPRPGPSPASNPRMADRHAPSRRQSRKVKTVMCQLAGLTLVIGHNALCHAEAPAPRPEPSPVLSPKMAESPALSRTPSRKVKIVMRQLAGLISEIGPSAPCPVEALAPRPEPSLALSLRAADLPVRKTALKKRVRVAMCQLAGQTLGSGRNAPFPAVAPAPKQDPSHALYQNMAAYLALNRTASRSPSLVMPQPAGQNTLNGLHARDSADKLEISPGAGAAFNQRQEACHAPMRPQRLRHRTAIPSDYL